jgi:hypothetical protein
MAELHSGRILLISSGTTSVNRHQNYALAAAGPPPSTSTACAPASLHIDHFRARLPPRWPPACALVSAFQLEAVPNA